MNKAIVLSDVGLRDVNPIQYGDEECPAQKKRVRTLREYYLLHYIYSGAGQYEAGNRVYRVEAGQLFIIHPHEAAYYEPDRATPWHYCWVGFKTMLDIPRLKTEYVLDAHYAEHIFRSISATDESMQGREYYVSGKITEFLATLVSPDTHTNPKTFVDRAVEYIQKNYTRPIDIDTLAEQFHISHSYFSTAFRKKMGMPPHQYLMDIRLEHAASLMAEHGYNVGEAALGAGYGNVYNFSKMFKKKYGVSPSRYAADQRHHGQEE